MRYTKCCVPGCGSLRQDVILHKFPKCEKRLQLWLRSINCDNLLSLSESELARLQVCHKHFERKFVTEKCGILATAYPSLFTDEEISTGVPTSRNLHQQTIESEHGYSRKRHIDHNYFMDKPKASTSVSPLVSTTDVATATASSYSSAWQSKVTAQVVVPDVATATTSSHSSTLQSNIPAQVIKPDLPSQPILQKTGKKKKLLRTVESLTPKCRTLYKEYRKAKKLVNYTRRAKRALKFTKEHVLEEQITKLNPLARKMLLMQVRLCTKNVKGRRFTLDEKLIALSIMKQSPKAYKFLQKIFILPSKTTLKKMVQQLEVEPGINPQIFQSIKVEVDTWKEEKKYCSIIFDEMEVEPGLTYYQHTDKITGLVEINEKTRKFADHALVFMVKGVIHKWQQTIAYYFCEGATSSVDMIKLLKQIVSAVGNTGLVPVVFISDQGSAFQSALKKLQEETRRAQILANEHTDDTIQIEGFKLSVIADPPHLIKGIRNNFLTKDVNFEGKRATWSDIVDVYKTDCRHADMRLLHKLNDEHVLPEKIKKMKVKNCVRVFSKTMAGALSYTSEFSHYADGKPVSNTLKNTAEVVSFLDDLFDSVNGASVFNRKKKGKELRSAVTDKSKHHAFWANALQRLDRFKFIDCEGNEKIVPTIKNWITTLKSFRRLWQFFKGKGIKVMRPRYMNSDAIENFFGQVRAYNYRHVKPYCHSFTNTFKSLLITGFIKFHHASFNCEDDCSEQLLRVTALFKSLNSKNNEKHDDIDELNPEVVNSSGDSIEDSILEARKERMSIHARAYTAGWVIRKIFSKHQCKECKTLMLANENEETHKWITHKEYKNLKSRKLTYPSEYSVRYFGTIVQKTNDYLEVNGHKDNLSKNIKNDLLEKYDFEYLGCILHKCSIQNAFLTVTIKLTIFNWVNCINKILRGVDIVRLEKRNNLPFFQNQALNKYKKKCNKRK